MTRRHHVLLVAALLLGVPAALGAYETAADAMKAGQQKFAAKDYAGAAKDADEAIALAGDRANDRNPALLFKGQVAEAAKDPATAKAAYALVAADAAATVAQRVTAISKTAAILANEGKIAPVEAEFAKIAALPGVTTADQQNARLALAKAYEKCRAPARATETYAALVADPTASKWHRAQATRDLAGLLMTARQFDEARAAYARLLTFPDLGPKDLADVAMDTARTYERQGDFAQARAEFAKAAAVAGLDAKSRAGALIAVARTYQQQGDLVGMQQALGAVVGATPAEDLALRRDYALLATQQGQTDVADAAWAHLMALPGVTNAQYAEAGLKRLDLLATARQFAVVGPLATAAAASDKLTDEQRFLAALVAAGAATPLDGAPNAKAIPATTLDAEKQAKLYADAAKVFMRARHYAAARWFGDRVAAMFRPAPQLVCDCLFMDQAPFGVSGWQNSAIVKDPARRETRFEEYNKRAAALLVNDVNVTREVGPAAAGKQCGVGFYMAADVRGWHVYVHCRDDQIEPVRAGLARGDTLEMYFVPGRGACYYQWLLTVPSPKANCIPWMSPHRHYRKLDDFLQVEVAPVADGFGVYLFFPWDLLYDKLPVDGEPWTFGLVDWSRNGGFTWGSGQVHELARFGQVRFVGAAKYLPAIRRALVLKAYANYKRAGPSANTFWKDEMKGDRDFYAQVLQPQLAQYDELGKLVKADMPLADVDRLFAEVVPDWFELDYKIGELRAAYLEARWFAPAP